MLNVENFSSNLLSKRGLWIFIIFFTAILFVVTGWTQFSCYPMVTGGVLPKFCNSQVRKLEIIKDIRTHGNTLMIFASSPESDENVLRALTSSLDSPKVANNLNMLQRALAFNPKTPVDVLDAFVKSEDVGILENIAKRSNATPELLREVVNNPHADAFEVQKALVNNPQSPEDVLQKMAKSKEPKILWEIAKSKQANASVLRSVSNNSVSNSTIQRALAINQNTSEDILIKLAKSTETYVLFATANNPNATTFVMEKVGENYLTWKTVKIQILLASKNSISRKLMERLANSEANSDGKVVLWTLSENSALPSDLKKLVVEKLAQNLVSLSSETFQQSDVEDSLPNPLPENKKNNCPGKHLRNNLLGSAVAAVGFLFGGPVGALAAYATVTGSLETVTSVSGCQF